MDKEEEGTMTKDGGEVAAPASSSSSSLTEENVNKLTEILTPGGGGGGGGGGGLSMEKRIDEDGLSDVSNDTVPESPLKELNGEVENTEKESNTGDVDSTSRSGKDDNPSVNIQSNIVEKDQSEESIETTTCKVSSVVAVDGEPEMIVDSPPEVTGKDKTTHEEFPAAAVDEQLTGKTGASTSMDCGDVMISASDVSSEDGLEATDNDTKLKQKISVIRITKANENGILEIVAMTSANNNEVEDMDVIVPNEAGPSSQVRVNDNDESKDQKSKDKEDSDSDDENMGMIRLRDFSTLKEKSDDEEDEDDDVVLLTPPTNPPQAAVLKKTPLVKIQNLNVVEYNGMSLELDSGTEKAGSSVIKDAEANKIKIGVARRQLSYLSQQLTARNGVISLRPVMNGVVQISPTFSRMRAPTPVAPTPVQQQQSVRTYSQPQQRQSVLVSVANRPVPGLRPTSTITQGIAVQGNDRLVGLPNTQASFTNIRRNETLFRPGNTPGTLHVVRTASELYQQQRAAIAQPTAYRVASGTGVSNSNQPVTYSRSPILYNTAGGNFVTPVTPTGRVYSGVINNATGNFQAQHQQQQQGMRLASLASVTSHIMGSGRVARMQLSNTDAPHLTATVVNGSTALSASETNGVQTFVLDKATGSMIPLSSYQELTRAVIAPRPQSIAPAPAIVRPRGVIRQQNPLFTPPTTNTSSPGITAQLSTNLAPRSSTTSVNKGGRPRSKPPTLTNQLNPSVRAPQLIQQATRLIVPQSATNGVSSAASNSGSGTDVTAGTMIANSNMLVGGPADSGEKELTNSKTFPSLVVTVKPCLQERASKAAITACRTELDARVKTILMYSPSKFTEYLMQQGLIRLDQKCPSHPDTACKLGMYSDGGKKHPFSGGYVWIPECCSDKQVSVFTGSIFEASVYPPGTLMKLIYHWACQTPAVSVLQWVKVTSYYLKNFFTLLRSACVAGLHEHAVEMGGKGKYVEIGIITLGTTVNAQGGPSKQVKIEILGVFDPASKIIRMKVLNPQDDKPGDDRIAQIFMPLHAWVNKQSFILIDSSMDKTLLEGMGFLHVSQKSSNNSKISSTVPTNVNVMNYLKNIVPKMFQNTLCVLSKSLIQQFLDELSWREIWAGSPSKCFDTLLLHLIEMTRAETGETLISRLNKISLNPFIGWSYTPKSNSNNFEGPESRRPPAAPVTQAKAGPSSAREKNSALSALDSLGELAATFMGHSRTGKRKLSSVDDESSNAGPLMDGKDLHKLVSGSKMYILQEYYYAWIAPGIVTGRSSFAIGLKCPMCAKHFISNVDALRHVMQHVVQVDRSMFTQPPLCSYCVKELHTGTTLAQHVEDKHKLIEAPYGCRICCLKFGRENDLIVHMWTHHVQAETPYRCELCSYRSSFHFEVVDHFTSIHRDIDCTMCPVCLKVLAIKCQGDLKLVAIHLQNHVTRKSKKCQDCVLTFLDPKDLTAHILTDKAHSSQVGNSLLKRQKVAENPIGMAKPPPVNRTDRIPPPPPPKKPKTGGSVKPGVKTLNSAIAIPINPNEKFTYDRFTMRFTGCAKKTCWECKADLTPSHFTGRLKCNKCRYVTSCPTAMAEHTKTHPNSSSSVAVMPKSMKLPTNLKEFLKSEGPGSCLSCKTNFDFPDLLVHHMVTVCDQKSCKVENGEKGDIPTEPKSS